MLRLYAALRFDDNYFGAKQILLVALNLHLYTVGIFDDCIDIRNFPSLDDLKLHSEAKPALFRSMEESILSTSPDRCMTLAYKDSFVRPHPEKRLHSLAETVKWLGYSYLNIDANKSASTENDLRFSQLFGLGESLYLLINNEDSKRGLADLYFQAWPFNRKCDSPTDTEDAFLRCEKALAYDSSTEMQARIGNVLCAALSSNGQKPRALQAIKKAISDAERLDGNDENRFLLSALYDSCAGCLMDPETLDLEAAETCMKKCQDFASGRRQEGRDQLQFALYDMRYAEYKLVTGEFAAAKESVERAIGTIHRQPQSQHPHLLKAEALKSVIAKISDFGVR
jgi:tetratricopeptide (TPR) repeat protein